jgi:uncharacterized DUF497 family protein
MASFSWDPQKNGKLIQERGVSFEAILWSIQSGGLLDIVAHPNTGKYPRQKVFVARAFEYVYLVPFEERADGIRLVTIIPSRKAARKYLKRGEPHER